MLKIAKNLEQKFEKTVNVKNLGTDDSSEIKVKFKYKKSMTGQELAKDIFKSIVVGWTDIVDEDTNLPLTFSDENLELLSDYMPLVTAVISAYIDSVSAARVGN